MVEEEVSSGYSWLSIKLIYSAYLLFVCSLFWLQIHHLIYHNWYVYHMNVFIKYLRQTLQLEASSYLWGGKRKIIKFLRIRLQCRNFRLFYLHQDHPQMRYIEEESFFDILLWAHCAISGLIVAVCASENVFKFYESHTPFVYYSSCSKTPITGWRR